METKKTSKKQPKIETFRERYSRFATKLGCSITVTIIIVAICSFIITVGVFYLLNILWPMEGDRNPLTSAIFQGIWMTAFFFICDYFSLFERIAKWNWKSNKNRREKE